MKKFLYSVAGDLWKRYGDGISDLTILLPNNRSRVFLVDALCTIAGRPVWGPAYVSVDQLMCTASGLNRVDSILAITELYKIYSQYHSNENFDTFYHWGEVIINDFDAVDKYLVDAKTLFANIADLKALSRDASYLTEEQVEAIQRFCATFSAEKEPTIHQRKFLTIWDSLWNIYSEYTSLLASRGVGYSGMIYRRAAERIREDADVVGKGQYVVVGFNALSASEKVLFDALKNRYEADFYWDYDSYYTTNEGQEAGLFVRENMRRYPAPATFRLEDCFQQPKQINVISTASDSLQCKYATEFIESIGKVDKHTAIVLTDEGLLSPLLYSLPNSVGGEDVEYNVTMGYPLKTTLTYSFVERLLQLQQRARLQKNGNISFYHSDVEGLLSHPFLMAVDAAGCTELRQRIIKQGRVYVSTELFDQLCDILKAIFTIHSDWHEMGSYLEDVMRSVMKVEVASEDKNSRALRRECFGIVLEAVGKTTHALEGCGVDLSFNTYTSLLRRVLQGVRIPYKGEPLSGVQVMGILETRNLDFDNVLLLSMNDDNFPSGRINDISFIPYNLRFGYGLPTSKESEGVYAYYFYRLIQRASRVDMTYCSVGNERSSAEQSRYIYQLDLESPHELKRVDKGLNVNLSSDDMMAVKKSGEVMRRLERYLKGGDRTLSPSTFNNYLDCTLKFYFKAIAGIKPEEEIEEDIDTSLFGSIFHRAMEYLYTPLKRVKNPQKQIAELIGTEKVHKAVVDAFTNDYFAGEEVPESNYGGKLIVACDTIEKYINNCVLPYDAARVEQYEILELEYPMECAFDFGDKSIVFGGTSDRLDLVNGKVRIIDYKTGKIHLGFAGIASLFARDGSKSVGAVTQTLIYSMMAERAQREGKLTDGCGATPSLYYVRYMNNPDYSPLLNEEIKIEGKRGVTLEQVQTYADYAESFEEALADTLTELFDESVPFKATDNVANCAMCDFAKLCNRK